MRFVLLDETGGKTTADGGALSPAVLEDIATACAAQLNLEFSAEWGGNYTVRAGSSSSDIQPGEIVFAILAELPDAPGAIAYHDVQGAGVPVLFDGITLSDSLTGPGNSLSVAISHELMETAGDEGCNDWMDDGSGSSFAKEMCDAVEANAYPSSAKSLSSTVYVSDFLLKSFFVPGRVGPYSFMSLAGKGGVGPAGPMQTAPGGYQITRTTGAGEHQVSARFAAFSPTVTVSLTMPFAHTRASRRTAKRHLSNSRASRRGLAATTNP